jgi:2-methylcitrate dehydratase PrpD
VGEREKNSGADILASIVLGYEIAGRIDASGYLTSANTKRGVRLSSATWNLGPAATASYLMHLPAAGMADALALTVGALCAPGTYEVIGRHGTTERFVQLGAGVREGVFAAELARMGFTGTDTALEGPSGFYFVWTGKPDAPDELLADLGSRWHITDAILKPYGAGATNNFVIYATEKLVNEQHVRYEDIVDVTVRTTDWKHMHGVIDPGPFDDFEQAHVSCPFAVAVMLVFGVIGFLMEENDFPVAPVILGIVLGPMLEQNFVTSMIKSDGSFLAFFARPIAGVLGVATLLVWGGMAWRGFKRFRTGAVSPSPI